MKNTIIILLVLVVLGFAGYTFYNQVQPDYSYQPSATAPILNTPDNSFTTKPAPVVDETKDWKTYKNEKYGFEFKYPTSWKLSENIVEVYPGASFFGVRIEDLSVSGDVTMSFTINGVPSYTGGNYYKLTKGQNGMISIASEGFDTFEPEAEDAEIIEAYLDLGNTVYRWFFSSKRNAYNPEPVFKQILSTFRFTK
ncbi:MAG: hypothetical protein AAB364_02560 [Patescibacteria group bacterium]